MMFSPPVGHSSCSVLPFSTATSSSSSLRRGSNASAGCWNQQLLPIRRRLLLAGVPFRSEREFTLRKPHSTLRVSCLKDSKVTVVTGESWDKLISQSDIPVLVEFYASWCGPCKMVHRVVEEIAEEYDGRLKCFVLYTERGSDIAKKHNVKAVPAVVLFKNGIRCGFVAGIMPKEFFDATIEKVLSS